MLKLLGAIFCGLAAVGTTTYVIVRNKEQRTQDRSKVTQYASDAWKGLQSYWGKLFESKPVEGTV